MLAGLLAVQPMRVARATGTLYATPGGAGDCSSWATACTLQTALTGATSGDEIWAAAGVYTPTLGVTRTATFALKPGVALYGGFAVAETLRSQRNWETNVTVLSGDLSGNDGPNFDNNGEKTVTTWSSAQPAQPWMASLLRRAMPMALLLPSITTAGCSTFPAVRR